MNIIEQNKAVVTRFNREVLEGKSLTALDEIIDAQFINRTIPAGFPPGPEGMRLFLVNVLWKAFSDIRIDLADQIGEGDKVTTRKIIHAMHSGDFLHIPATGKEIHINLIDIVRLENGRYMEHWGASDMMFVMTQLKPS